MLRLFIAIPFSSFQSSVHLFEVPHHPFLIMPPKPNASKGSKKQPASQPASTAASKTRTSSRSTRSKATQPPITPTVGQAGVSQGPDESVSPTETTPRDPTSPQSSGDPSDLPTKENYSNPETMKRWPVSRIKDYLAKNPPKNPHRVTDVQGAEARALQKEHEHKLLLWALASGSLLHTLKTYL